MSRSRKTEKGSFEELIEKNQRGGSTYDVEVLRPDYATEPRSDPIIPPNCVNEATYDLNFIRSTFGIPMTSQLWGYLKYITTEKGKTPSSQCASHFYGPFLEHDQNNSIIFKNDIPKGWICNDDPFTEVCRHSTILDNKSKFVRWTELVNEGVLEGTPKITEINKNVPSEAKKFALPSNKSDFENFKQTINNVSAQILMAKYVKGRKASFIRKDQIKDQVKESKTTKKGKNADEDLFLKNLQEVDAEKIRMPLTFNPSILIETAWFPDIKKNMVPVQYEIHSYEKKHKEEVLSRSEDIVPASHKEIINRIERLNKNEARKENEVQVFSSQINALGENIKEMISSTAQIQNLCKNPNTKSAFIPAKSTLGKRGNHFDFQANVCLQDQQNFRQFEVRPLFNGWVNKTSINEKIGRIQSVSQFIDEVRTPSKDASIGTETKKGKKVQITDEFKINVVDTTPLILSLSTGFAMTPHFASRFKSDDYYVTQIHNASYLSAKEQTQKEKDAKIPVTYTISTSDPQQTKFHQCALNVFNNHTYKEKIEVNGIDVTPFRVRTTEVIVDDYKTKTKNYGVAIDWAALSTVKGDVGTMFNYNDIGKLGDLQKFVMKGISIQNQVIQACIPKK